LGDQQRSRTRLQARLARVALTGGHGLGRVLRLGLLLRLALARRRGRLEGGGTLLLDLELRRTAGAFGQVLASRRADARSAHVAVLRLAAGGARDEQNTEQSGEDGKFLRGRHVTDYLPQADSTTWR